MGEVHIQNDIISLCNAYENKFKIGAALNHFTFLHNNTESEIVKKHFNLITAENATKMDNIFLSENNLNFSIVDKFLEFGKNNNKSIHWHTLLWHKQTPKWLFEKENGIYISKNNLNCKLKKYIQTVVDHTRDSVSSFDVINEAISEKTLKLKNLSDGSLWQHILGNEYIENAFNWAHEANPAAELILTENDLVSDIRKRDATFEFVKDLLAKKIPVSAIGIQLHANLNTPSIQEIKNTIEQFGNLGIKVVISSLDVSLYKNDLEPTKEYTKELFELQADRYSKLFDCFKEEAEKGILSSVTFWGVTDKTSWKNDNPVEKRTDAPLIFDRFGLAKPAFYAIIK